MTNSNNLRLVPESLAISERELTSLTADLVDAHEESRSRSRDALAAWDDAHGSHVTTPSTVLSRRRLLGAGGLAALGLLVVGAEARTSAPAAAAVTRADVPVDVKVAALAASLENLAVATYAAGLKAATQGKLGAVPPAVATFATTAMAQHKDHAQIWNATLKSAGYAKVTKPDPVEQKAVDAAFAKVTTIPELAKLALLLEGVAAATYLEGLAAVTSVEARQTAASIHPVEMQHVAVLRFVLGESPVPSAFASTAMARPVTDTPFT